MNRAERRKAAAVKRTMFPRAVRRHLRTVEKAIAQIAAQNWSKRMDDAIISGIGLTDQCLQGIMRQSENEL